MKCSLPLCNKKATCFFNKIPMCQGHYNGNKETGSSKFPFLGRNQETNKIFKFSANVIIKKLNMV